MARGMKHPICVDERVCFKPKINNIYYYVVLSRCEFLSCRIDLVRISRSRVSPGKRQVQVVSVYLASESDVVSRYVPAVVPEQRAHIVAFELVFRTRPRETKVHVLIVVGGVKVHIILLLGTRSVQCEQNK